MDEVFICGPEGMIDRHRDRPCWLARRLTAHTERFTSAQPAPGGLRPVGGAMRPTPQGEVELTVMVLDGKPHELRHGPRPACLDVALDAGLTCSIPQRPAACCTCRAKVMEGSVSMDRNFTLSPGRWNRACAELPGRARHQAPGRQHDER